MKPILHVRSVLTGILSILLFSLLTGTSHSSEPNSFVRVSEKNPNYFELSDGTPYIPIGVNLCILREDNADGVTEQLNETERGLAKMEFYFKKLSENGGNYARIWLSSTFYEIETDGIGVYDEKKLDRLAQTLALAKKYNIRLKLCFEHFRTLDKNSKQAIFIKSLYFHPEMKTMRDYVNSARGKTIYLNRCAAFQRFRDDPNVFGWELWNEVNCIPDYYQWTKEMLPKVHKLFPKHLVFQSLGSFDSPGSWNIYEKVIKLPENEIAQIHRYLDSGAGLPICRGPMDLLAADSMKTMRKMIQNRPILSTEMGAVEWRHAGPSKLYSLDREGILLHDILFVPFFCGSAGSGHSWHWYRYIEKNDLWFHIGRFSKAIRGINPIEEKFEPFESESGPVRIYGLKGTKTTLLFVRDRESNWQTELIDKKPAPLRQGLALNLPQMNLSGKARVSFYNPWNDTESRGTIESGRIALPDFRRSFVVRLEK